METFGINLNAIKEICDRNRIDMAVLFGSFVSERVSNESDIDVGIFRKGLITLDDQALIYNELSDLFKNNKVDISIISSNNPLLMHNILQNGRVLYSNEASLFIKLKLYAWKLFAESKNFRDHSFNILQDRVASM